MDRWLLAAVADILRSGLSRQDTEELLAEAMETSGISPDVAATVSIFGGPRSWSSRAWAQPTLRSGRSTPYGEPPTFWRWLGGPVPGCSPRLSGMWLTGWRDCSASRRRAQTPARYGDLDLAAAEPSK